MAVRGLIPMSSLAQPPAMDRVRDPWRLVVLRSTGLLDQVREPSFDRLTRLTARVLKCPVALVSLVDIDRQFFTSSYGLPQDWAERRETPLSHSFCQYVVESACPLVVTDARVHPLLKNNAAVADLGVVAYLGVPLRATDGEVLGSFCVIDTKPRAWTDDDLEILNDLAESASTEIALRSRTRREEEELYRLVGLLEHSGDFIASATLDGQVTYVNPAGRELVGLSGAEGFHGTKIVDYLTDATRRSALEEAIPTALKRGHWQGEGMLRHFRTGEAIAAEINLFLVRQTHSDAPQCLATIIRDARDRKRFEADLQASKEAAEAASRSKSEFLANVSHEVRTPMAAILGYSEILLDPEVAPPERDHALQAIRRNGFHLLQIINDILDLSKIEAGKLEFDPVPYSPWRVVTEVVSTLRVRADERGLTMEARASTPLPASVVFDPTRVRQILVNLVSNAIKFSRSGGRVVVRVAARPLGRDWQPELLVDVEDEGIGIAPEQLSLLFTPFQQADTSTTRRFGGTGLGLSITRRLVEAMNGTITVVSEPGRGSRFSVSLPLAPSWTDSRWLAAEELDRLAIDPTWSDLGSTASPRMLAGRVLLAEDSPDNRSVLVYHLSRVGLKAVIAEDGRAAVEAALRRPFDLILMDMQMPELDGYSATAALREAGYQGPIVALTAHAMQADRDKCLAVGCTDYLTKPIDPPLFVETIARYLPTPAAFEPPTRSWRRPAPQPPPIVTSEIDDPTVLLPRLGADPALLPLVRDYAHSLPGRVDDFRAAIADDARDRLAGLAHQTKGVGGMYGYPDLTESAALIESAAREGQDNELLSALVDEFDALTARIVRGIEHLGRR